MFKLTAAVLILAASLVNGETVTVRSGNGSVGSRDNSVHFLLGPTNTDFGHAFTSTDFLNAQNGPASFIVNKNPLWISGLSQDAYAKWISTNSGGGVSQGNTALYAVKFGIMSAFALAALTLRWGADDGLGLTIRAYTSTVRRSVGT